MGTFRSRPQSGPFIWDITNQEVEAILLNFAGQEAISEQNSIKSFDRLFDFFERLISIGGFEINKARNRFESVEFCGFNLRDSGAILEGPGKCFPESNYGTELLGPIVLIKFEFLGRSLHDDFETIDDLKSIKTLNGFVDIQRQAEVIRSVYFVHF